MNWEYLSFCPSFQGNRHSEIQMQKKKGSGLGLQPVAVFGPGSCLGMHSEISPARFLICTGEKKL
ncbi:hypothetical protein BRADI_3g42714v3 [Brachypodium distachyon]|uniref:Uncharacterized protein n=1 Tax=Brachypodium distachyon TaxID=15368 RepID=A0A2K2D2S8_BRADI|nr:hypothetical protein BRADI_3g42714v3 [Brachypodium distachyon]